MDSTPRSILIMDANQRSALAVTRALGRRYPHWQLTTADSTATALAGKSRFSRAYLRYPDPMQSTEAFVQWVMQHRNRFDLIMPTTEVTSQTLLLNSERLPGLPLPFADMKTLLALADKANLVRLAIAANINVPDTRFFSSAEELDRNSLSYPCVLKPNLSKIHIDGRWISTTVRLLSSAADLQAALNTDSYLYSQPFMIQAYIPGSGAGLFCLYHQGQAIQFFAHRRLREKPPSGGVSVLSQATRVDPQLETHTRKLLDSVHWHGIAMVEYRVTESGEAYLMEVNTRFWGSLQLAIDSGANFPVMLVQAFFNDPIERNQNINLQQRLRWFLGDVDSLYLYLRSPHRTGQKLRRILQFLTPQFRHQRHEVNQPSDLGPAVEEFKQYLRALRG